MDDGVIATCAHCLCDNKKFYTNYTISVYNAAGTKWIATYSASELHVPEEYYENRNPYYDYGLIYVDADLSVYGKMALGLPTDQFKEIAQIVYASGFPGYVNGNLKNMVYDRYISSGIVNATLTDDYFMWFTAFASKGDSGGPVFVEYTLENETFRSAVGIITNADSTISCGPRITLPVLRFFYSNPNIG